MSCGLKLTVDTVTLQHLFDLSAATVTHIIIMARVVVVLNHS